MQCNTIKVLEQVRTTIDRHNLFKKGDNVLLGVSGGADSVCLLHVLNQIKKELEITISVAHIHHGIRGEEANRDAEFVRNLCKKMKIPYFLRKISVPEYAKEEGLSEEMAGRVLRYRCFRELCDANDFSKIVTAHHQNDQAETVLMRVLRGAGIEGLSGIRYARQDGVVRPLLDVTRKEIEAYCSENELAYCIDSTNECDQYARNYIRNQLLPELEKFNPNVATALSNLAKNMAEDGDFLKDYAKRLYRRLGSPLPNRKPVVLEVESLKMLEPSIQVRLLKMAAEDTMGKGYRSERKHWESVLGLLEKQTGTKVDLPGGLVVSVGYGWLTFEKQGDEENGLFFDTIPVVPGESYQVPGGTVSLLVTKPDVPLKSNQWMLDYYKIKDFKLELRTRKDGDKIAVYKDGKERKLKSFLIDEKIPQGERDKLILLCSEDKVLAVPPYRIAEPYKVDSNTEKGLVVTYDTENENR